jgi:hypothetical protein
LNPPCMSLVLLYLQLTFPPLAQPSERFDAFLQLRAFIANTYFVFQIDARLFTPSSLYQCHATLHHCRRSSTLPRRPRASSRPSRTPRSSRYAENCKQYRTRPWRNACGTHCSPALGPWRGGGS